MKVTPSLRMAYAGFAALLLVCLLAPPGGRTARAQSGLVRAVLFTSPTCTFCQEIVHQELPPLLQPFGEQLQILYVNVETEAGQRLYQAALTAFSIPRGIPLILLGEDWLMGVNIPAGLPALIEKHLSQGGVDWPAIPGLKEYLLAESQTPTPTVSTPTATPLRAVVPATPVVRAVLFWMATCPHCHEVLENVLPPLQEQYGDLLEIWLIELQSNAEAELLYHTAERYGLSPERVGVPFLVIGEYVLIGARQIPERLPGLIDNYLAQGGVDWPAGLTPPANATFFSSFPTGQTAATPAPTVPLPAMAPSPKQPGGFGLALAVLLGMVVALLYSMGGYLLGKIVRLPDWMDWAIPIIILAGILVAGYLSYVEIRMADPVCGPVGDCRAVQSSCRPSIPRRRIKNETVRTS